MKLVLSVTLIAAAVFAAAPLPAQVKPDKTPAAAPASGTAAPSDADADPPVVVQKTTGEITDLAERSFRIRPWKPELPARIQVTATPATRYFKQSRGKPRDVQVGDLVLVVPEEAPVRHEKSFYVVLRPNSKPVPPEKTPEARGVIRLWKVGTESVSAESVSAEDRRNARVLLEGALPFFKGGNEGGINAPAKKEKLYTGVVTSLQPMRVQTVRGVKEFKLDDDTLVVNHSEIKPDTLKKGQTVVIRSPTKPGADASLQADLIAVCPEPEIGSKTTGKILQREKKRKEH